MNSYKEKKELVNNVFDVASKKYDLMNDLMSLGVHRIWKKKVIDWIKPRYGDSLIDVASGTGDMAKLFSLHRRLRRYFRIILSRQPPQSRSGR